MLKKIIISAITAVAALGAIAVPAAASAGPAPARACSTSMSIARPWHNLTTDVRVKTKGLATVNVYAHFKKATRHKTGHANAAGRAVIPLNIGAAPYGYKVQVTVKVREGSFRGSCSASFIPTKVYHAGSCTSSGGYATCVEGGTANNPVRLYADVTSKPHQSVLVTWDMVCSRGLSAASSSGQYTATTPILRVMRHPFKHPDSCTVAVGGGLNASGSLTVKALYQK